MSVPYLADSDLSLHHGDALEVLGTLPERSVHCCVTSPPFWALRDYQVDGQIGLEETPEEWCANLVDVFREVKRVLRDDGTLWLEVGDSYATRPVAAITAGTSRASPTQDASRKRSGTHSRRQACRAATRRRT